MRTYQDFLRDKIVEHESVGFEPGDLNPNLFPFQREVVTWACKVGRAAVFADCGLGKTLIQLDWARLVHAQTGKPVLILAPLCVTAQTQAEAERFGISGVRYVQEPDASVPIMVTNYDRLDAFAEVDLGGAVLDESSILKNYTGKTRVALQNRFAKTPYLLCCTGTPAPNDLMEIGNHAEFLRSMQSNEMLARWFINDTANFGNYRLKQHAAKDFWRWVSTWAVCFGRPQDLGFEMEGYDLPPLDIEIVSIPVDMTDGAKDGEMFRQSNPSSTRLFAEKSLTVESRVAAISEIVNATDEPFIVWCHTNEESRQLAKAIPDAVEVVGSQPVTMKEYLITQFTKGEARVIVTKPEIAGFGMNWQHCRNVAFVGLSYSFEQWYQAIRRTYRFGQTKRVNVFMAVPDSESGVLDSLQRKMDAHKQMQDAMNQQSNQMRVEARLGLVEEDIHEVAGETWRMMRGDCVNAIAKVQDHSIDFCVHSPPFANLYIYSDALADMGNCADMAEFMDHYRFLIRQLFRKMRPGRVVAVHCKDLVAYKGRDGEAGIVDFPGEIIRAFTGEGFAYHSRVTIWKCPVTEMQRTKSHGLLHKTSTRDSSHLRMGLPDYLLAFRRWPKNEEEDEMVVPVTGEGDGDQFRFSSYVGMDPPRNTNGAREFSILTWQRYASPVWDDINQMNVLNVQQARSGKDEKHICPLQLDVIQRAIHLWSNPGDLVFSPFAGIGSEGVGALREGRQFLGVELKPQYFDHAVQNLAAEQAAVSNDLFSGVLA